MNKEKLIEYLEFAKKHYRFLGFTMLEQGKNGYANEHYGKIKFIDLLLLMINSGEFDDL